jgi:hypothetical protein
VGGFGLLIWVSVAGARGSAEPGLGLGLGPDYCQFSVQVSGGWQCHSQRRWGARPHMSTNTKRLPHQQTGEFRKVRNSNRRNLLNRESITYLARVVDSRLSELFGAMGGVVVEGPRACGKTSTGLHQARSSIRLDASPQGT